MDSVSNPLRVASPAHHVELMDRGADELGRLLAIAHDDSLAAVLDHIRRAENADPILALLAAVRALAAPGTVVRHGVTVDAATARAVIVDHVRAINRAHAVALEVDQVLTDQEVR